MGQISASVSRMKAWQNNFAKSAFKLVIYKTLSVAVGAMWKK